MHCTQIERNGKKYRERALSDHPLFLSSRRKRLMHPEKRGGRDDRVRKERGGL